VKRQAYWQAGLILAAIVLFQIVMGLPLLAANDPYWIEPKGDMATMMAGHYAVIDHPWRFPLAETTALRGEALPISIVYTDSLPWVTILMKALGLGRVINPLALFLLVSYIAQPLAMVALLRACGVKRTSSLMLGALIALFYPAWFVRQFGHIALAGHWLLILSLAWSVQVARLGLSRRRIVEITALGVVALGVHPYHVVPFAACLGAGLLSELLQRRGGALRLVMLTVVSVGLAMGLSAWVLGYSNNGGQSGGGAAMGAYSMNILGPILPQASAAAGQAWDGRWFTGTLDANGGQTFEGYAYLGAGLLLLAIVAASLAVWGIRRDGAGLDVRVWSRFGPLLVAMIVLTLWAIGPRPYFGMQLLFDLPRPTGKLGDLIGLFRAHGRFFWIVGYAVLALAVARIDKLESDRIRLGLLALALLLQVFDMTQMIRGVRATYQPVTPMYDSVVRADPAFERRPWRFQPLVECVGAEDGWVIVQMSSQALRRHGVSNSGPSARPLNVSCQVDKAATVNAAPGDRTLTAVIGDRSKQTALFDQFKNRSDCYVFMRGLLCGRDLAQTGLEPYIPLSSEAIAAARVIRTAAQRPAALGDGWAPPEPHGTWTSAKTAWLTVDNETPDFVLLINLVSVAPTGPQRVEFLVDGRLMSRARVSTPGLLTARISSGHDRGPTRIEIRLPDAALPSPVDPRLLGIGVDEIRVVPLRQ
jgi:hypothetical protein